MPVVSFDDYDDAFHLRACYERLGDAVTGPTTLAISCALPRAGFQIVNIAPQGNCDPVTEVELPIAPGDHNALCMVSVAR